MQEVRQVSAGFIITGKRMRIKEESLLKTVPAFSGTVDVEATLKREKIERKKVVVVLDDDPTGIQTVHDVYFYTDWSQEVLVDAFASEKLFFIHTNTRALTEAETERINRDIMKNCIKASRVIGRGFSIISRSDSTLRGHYPLETSVLRQVYEKETNEELHGEVIVPCFFEGGRYTYGDIHYVKEKGYFVPIGETEYAQDTVFGYRNSDLKAYVEEKTKGEWKAEEVASVPVELLRKGDIDSIVRTLLKQEGFQKIIVNAMCYDDLRVFLIALFEAERRGKRFLFRTAASFVKVYGLIEDRDLLCKSEIRPSMEKDRRVLTVVGSHIKKTNDQLEDLLSCSGVRGIQLDVERVLGDESSRHEEITKKRRMIEEAMESSLDPVLYTSRRLVRTSHTDSDGDLCISNCVSNAIVDLVKCIKHKPCCIIAKGGITSSDILVKGLGVTRATVVGQVIPGVPVIRLEGVSEWKDVSYIIFPGNVGDRNSLHKVYMMVA